MGELIAFVPTSFIPSHPDTSIIEETIASIRFHLPHKIIILADSLRPEQLEHSARYERYKTNIPPRHDVFVYHFAVFSHQIGMMRNALEQFRADKILFCEHDTPLAKKMIDWMGIIKALDSGDVNLVRFLPEPEIHPEHQHLMCGEMVSHGVPLTKTIQFSARPHIATRAFYEKLLARFSPNAKCFLEDHAHGFCQNDGWDEWKMSIYTPPGNKQRSLHLDGRAGSKKYDETQTF